MCWKKELEQLEYVFSHPRLHLSNYFADLRSEVDVAFVRKDSNESDPLIKSEIKKNWVEMIEKINEFEQQCQRKQKTNSFDKELTARILSFIETCHSIQTDNYSNDETSIKEMIYAETVNLERVLFLNRLMTFLLREKGQHVILCKKLDLRTTVGKLIYVNNEYMGSKCIQLLKKKLIISIFIKNHATYISN